VLFVEAPLPRAGAGRPLLIAALGVAAVVGVVLFLETPGGPGPAAKPKLALDVHPRTTETGELTRFEFRVTSRGHAIAGATVRLGAKTKTTGRRGRASISRRFNHPGTATARVTRAGYRPGRVTITIADD
jgi:hypothetical protein